MTTPDIQTTIANLLERRQRTGLVFQDRLLDAVVGLLGYVDGLERRLVEVERELAIAARVGAAGTAWGHSGESTGAWE